MRWKELCDTNIKKLYLERAKYAPTKRDTPWVIHLIFFPP